VKELRLAKAKTCEQANAVLAKLVPSHNAKFGRAAGDPLDAHRQLGAEHRLESILSIQTVRVVSNDYVVRLANRCYQLQPPTYPGLRGGRVVMEERGDGTLAIRFGMRHLPYVEMRDPPQGRTKFDRPGSSSSRRTASAETRPPSGRSNEGASASPKPTSRGKPSPHHPWKQSYK